MDSIKVNALMLRAVDYLENDRILTLLTAERGRITAGIKGVKKAGAKLKFAAQPFCFAEYILAEKSGRYTVVQASECESFYEIRGSVEKYYAACSVCEVAIALTEEGVPDAEVFSAAVRSLTDMCTGDEALSLIAFLLTALKSAGYGLALPDRCPSCGEPLHGAERLRLDFDTGAFACYACGSGAGVSGATYAALTVAVKGEGTPTPEGKKRALKLLREYVARKTDAQCKCLGQFIDML